VLGTIITPKLGLQPKPLGEACYATWRGQPALLPEWRALIINIVDSVHILGSGPTDSDLVVGDIAKAKLSLQPKMFDAACYAYWQDGDFTKANGW